MLEHAGEQLKTTDFGGFLTKKLPRPDNLESEGILPQDYHRIAVSYGLSHAFIDIGTIRPPRDVSDFTCEAKLMDIDKFYIDKDMV